MQEPQEKKTEYNEKDTDDEMLSGKASRNDKLHEIEPSNCNEKSSNQILIISNESLSDYLKNKLLPVAPKRQGKRQTDKMPFALTSDVYVDLLNKQNIKKQVVEAD